MLTLAAAHRVRAGVAAQHLGHGFVEGVAAVLPSRRIRAESLDKGAVGLIRAVLYTRAEICGLYTWEFRDG